MSESPFESIEIVISAFDGSNVVFRKGLVPDRWIWNGRHRRNDRVKLNASQRGARMMWLQFERVKFCIISPF